MNLVVEGFETPKSLYKCRIIIIIKNGTQPTTVSLIQLAEVRCTVSVYMVCLYLNSLSATLRKIEKKQQCPDEDFENPRNPKNLITFLQWMLGHVPEAEAMAAREVQESPSDILALSNSAYVLWQKGETGEAWGRLEKLEALRDGDQQLYDDLEIEGRPFKLPCISAISIA